MTATLQACRNKCSKCSPHMSSLCNKYSMPIQTNWPMDRQVYRQTDRWTIQVKQTVCPDRQSVHLDRWIHRLTDPSETDSLSTVCPSGEMDGRTDREKDTCTERWTDRWINRGIYGQMTYCWMDMANRWVDERTGRQTNSTLSFQRFSEKLRKLPWIFF